MRAMTAAAIMTNTNARPSPHVHLTVPNAKLGAEWIAIPFLVEILPLLLHTGGSENTYRLMVSGGVDSELSLISTDSNTAHEIGLPAVRR